MADRAERDEGFGSGPIASDVSNYRESRLGKEPLFTESEHAVLALSEVVVTGP
jgi:hypothetical protein